MSTQLEETANTVLLAFAKRIEGMQRGKTYGWGDEVAALTAASQADQVELLERILGATDLNEMKHIAQEELAKLELAALRKGAK